MLIRDSGQCKIRTGESGGCRKNVQEVLLRLGGWTVMLDSVVLWGSGFVVLRSAKVKCTP